MITMLKKIFEEAIIPIVCSDSNHFLYWNSAFESLTGYSREDLQKMSFDNLYPENIHQLSHQQLIQKTLEANNQEVVDLHLQKQDKTTCKCEISTITIELHQSIILITFIRDVTFFKTKDRKSYENIQRLQMAIRATNQGLWDWNCLTDETFYSEEYFRMLGYEPDEFKPSYEKWVSLLYPNDKEMAIKAQNMYLKGEIDKYQIEFRMKCKNGKYIWTYTEAIIAEKDNAGNPTRMIGIVVDINEKKENELKLKEQSQKLIDYSFFNSHQLRAPLATLMGIINILKYDFQPEYIEHLETYANKLDDMIRELNVILNEESQKGAIPAGVDSPIKKISLIDDDKIFHIVYKKTVENYRADLITDVYDKARIVLEKIRKDTFKTDLILLDISMEDMSGWQFLEEFEKMELGIPVFVLTSSIDIADVQKSKQYSSVKGFIVKPLTSEALDKIFQQAGS